MSERLTRFTDLMRSIFELDKSDLDFGIYRILNIRRTKIDDFLTKGLPQKVQETLKPFAEDGTGISKRLKEIEDTAQAAGIEITASPVWAAEYEALKKKKATGTDISALETDVYSALYSFFNRYYDEGDFISKRRYKEGVYAIPYEGEEVKLYWANQDQYYIKTSENFKDYAFVAQGISVHFRLVDATTEKDNIKEADDSKRVFMLFAEDEETYPGIHTFEYDQEKRELIIRFVFNIPEDKKRKHAEENYTAIKGKIVKDYDALIAPLLRDVSKDPRKPKTVLQRHLEAYVAKNTFDYFIHKDLGGFLRRELDFYIKSEVMHLDDLDTDNEHRVETWLAKVKAIKRVGHIIIDFLAQIEDFQKKLWLKKKFVVETNWCITLDRIDRSFWPEIAANQQQIKEWMDLYAIQEAEGWSNPPSLDFLKENQNLVVDTRHFTEVLKNRLMATFDNLDEQSDGLMVHSENFQALRSLINTYAKRIDGIYIDPPYNTNASEIIYKNGYRSSSWMSLMNDRIYLGRKFLGRNGLECVTIDDFQFHELYYIPEYNFGSDRHFGTIVIKNNPQGRSSVTGFQISHEYGLFYGEEEAKLGRLDRNEEQLARYDLTDENGLYEWRNFRAQYSQESQTMVYPIYIKKDCSDFRIPKLKWDDNKGNFVALDEPEDDESVSLPMDETGRMRTWKWGTATVISLKDSEMGVRKDRLGQPAVYYKGRMKELGILPFTIWDKPDYSASTFGANVLSDMIGKKMFNYPKSVFAVVDSLRVLSEKADARYFDFFAGSGTTGHAVIALNRQDQGQRKYIMVEMGHHFDAVTKPRMQKVIYSNDWKDGKPQNRNTGVSHLMKYIRLESYEDALSNISLDKDKGDFLGSLFGEEYLVRYLMDTETSDSLLDIQAFCNPFQYQMKITDNNEAKLRPVDVVETFNYLIGLRVSRQGTVDCFDASPEQNGVYEGAVRLARDDGGQFAFQQVEGALPDGRRALVIWRTVTDDLIRSNAALDAYFTRYRINPNDREYDVIFVNGDNNLDNMRGENEQWKVVMTELEFKARMFEES